MKKVLVANRGEIAVRILRACQELGLNTVAVFSTADSDSLHTKLADEAVCIGPGQSLQSYLHIPRIMSAAEITGVDAIHPGYGFLSESYKFAEICENYRIKFIGPTAKQIRMLGDKVQARGIAKSAGVPLLPGSDGCVGNVSDAVVVAKDIGYPVIIKAAAGGGGRGMKIVHEEAQLKDQFQIAKSEALSCFGSDEVFIEKYLTNPRHVEVQILADQSGNIVHLGERDCSIQRRHQKIIEECPSPALNSEERRRVGELAISLCQTAGYQSLGTVEFLYQDGAFYFMEVNTRAQVEHPVTEEVTGIDLIKEQIEIAQGKKIPMREDLIPRTGHALECRINAEDPQNFAPWPGQVTAFHQPGGPGVRVDSMLYAGYTVPPLYDSMIAKVITSGRTRAECVLRMRRALREMKVEGIRTNIEFHLRLLETPEFLEGRAGCNFVQSFLG